MIEEDIPQESPDHEHDFLLQAFHIASKQTELLLRICRTCGMTHSLEKFQGPLGGAHWQWQSIKEEGKDV